MGRLGAVWRWGWALGFAFLCAHMAFEVLDLDGSQAEQRTGAAITSETSSAEADRILKEGASPPLLSLYPGALGTQTRLRLQPAGTRLRTPRNDSFLPRRHLSRLDSPASEQPADPA